MAAAGRRLREAGVGCIYLLHGTFAGFDALGLLAGLARVYPPAREMLGPHLKQAVDRVMGENGNWTHQYAALLEQSLAGGGPVEIAVRRFAWSGENHHLGRADGAVRLIERLAADRHPPGTRLLLWGHSHAGNVLALVSQLLAGDAQRVASFFAAARSQYQWPLLKRVDVPVWRHVQRMLEAGNPLVDCPLDVMTLGTPLRYGWDARGVAKLLHVVNHHRVDGLRPEQGRFPPTLDDVLHASGGDLVQLIGIAGTNLPPGWLSWRRWLADWRLNRLLQGEHHAGNLLARLARGCRVPSEGRTVLIDYGRQEGSMAQHLAGHAVYTRAEWMLLHAELAVEEMTNDQGPMSNNDQGPGPNDQ